MKTRRYPIALQSVNLIYRINTKSQVNKWFVGFIVLTAAILFLPWTQNIKSKGSVTTLYQDQRPQDINAPIAGKIVKWWVKEGDFVKKGDTILQISEIKAEYLDPKLIDRTIEQVNAKKGSVRYYQDKAATASQQIDALQNSLALKTEQIKNKLSQLNSKLNAEQAELTAVSNELALARDQYERQQKMYDEGLVSKTQLQQRNISYQNVQAKKTVAENKIAQTRQEIINTQIEQNSVAQEYREKINKAEGDKLQSLGQVAGTEGEVAKLENQVSSYIIRNGMYILLAPQDGQIVQANKAGLGEIIKEGEKITMIIPTKIKYAVEMYVKPMDLPLVNVGQKVRFQFDGFPAIIFSGWPEKSYGTFSGKIIAYESNISANGLFKVLVVEDPESRKWPEQLKIGCGAQGITLLKDVPVWYEIWRNINGFPPDYYSHENKDLKTEK